MRLRELFFPTAITAIEEDANVQVMTTKEIAPSLT